MVFHMLRRHLGRRGVRPRRSGASTASSAGRRASWADLTRVFSDAAGEDLAPFFAQWVERTGAPGAGAGRGDRWTGAPGAACASDLRQVQEEAPYAPPCPRGGHARRRQPRRARGDVRWTDREARSSSRAGGRSRCAWTLDPAVRRLPPAGPQRDPADRSASCSARTASRSSCPATGRTAGRRVAGLRRRRGSAAPAARWRSSRGRASTRCPRTARSGSSAPGTGGPGARPGARGLRGAGHGRRAVSLRRDRGAPRRTTASSIVVRAPREPRDWRSAGSAPIVAAALPGLARKLPHYGKYSYLAFAGDEPPTTSPRASGRRRRRPLVRVPDADADGPSRARRPPGASRWRAWRRSSIRQRCMAHVRCAGRRRAGGSRRRHRGPR